MNTISFMTANYVARELGYHMTEWGAGDRATQQHYKPIATYHERLNEVFAEIEAMGFDAIDLWLPLLHPEWATAEHVSIAQNLLHEHKLKVVSLAGWFGSTPDQFERSCQLAQTFGAAVLGGNTSVLEKDRAFVANTLRQYAVKLGVENHPEKTPDVLLRKMGLGDADVIGAAVDTGWFGTQAYDAARAIGELRERLFLVHMKDVREVGTHHTCRYGEGIVPIRECVETLKRIGYSGVISVEHEPETFDPTEDVKASYAMLREWLNPTADGRRQTVV